LLSFFNEKCSDDLKLNSESEEVIDLVDSDGQNKNISDRSIKNKNASLFIQPRKTYVLAKVKQNEKNETLTVPLIENKDIIKNPILTKPIKKALKTDMLNKSLSKSDFFNSSQPKSDSLKSSQAAAHQKKI